MRNWAIRYKAAAAGFLLGLTAISAGLLWPSETSVNPVRPLLAGLDQRSSMYLNRHAQPWLTCPAAATRCYRWKMQEAAGNLVDDLSGDSAVLTAVGTPTYRIHTPIPDTTGLNGRRGIWTPAGDTSKFIGANATMADVTTNDFSFSFWLYYAHYPTTAGNILMKRGAKGYSLYITTAGVLTISINDGSGIIGGAVSAALPYGSWSFYTLNFDRDGNAYVFRDNVALGVLYNISAQQNSLSDPNVLYLFASSGGLGNDMEDSAISELIFANGLTTLAEHQAAYKAFKVPTSSSPGVVGTPTYTQLSTRKWALPPEAGFGERLGVYAGGANPQWPTSYDATKVEATKGNALGLGFPESGATTNIIGNTNQFDAWTLNVATVVANKYEAPDGSMTADEVTFTGPGSYIRQGPGGVIAAGAKWYASVYFKKISGTGTYLCYRPTIAGGGWESQLLTTVWQRTASRYPGLNPLQRQMVISCSTAPGTACDASNTDCVLALADAQYEESNVTPPCTSTTGNVSQTCNASYYTLTIPSNKMTLLPAGLERFEIVHNGWSEPFTSAPTVPQVKWIYGNKSAYLAEGVTTALVLNNQGGSPEYVASYRGLGSATESRDYVSSWDLRNGLTNTSPRRYGGLSIARNSAAAVYTPFNLEGRKVDATIDAATPPQQLDLNSNVVRVGCDNSTGTPTNCSQGGVSNFEVWGRPAQDIKATDSTSILNADFTGASYLQAQAIPRFEIPSGATSDNTWIWDMGEYSGSLYDRINGVALAPSGTPRYQAWSGLLARGQGRRGVWFDQVAGTNTKYVEAPTLATNSITGTAATWEAIITAGSTIPASFGVVGSARYSSGPGPGYLLYGGNGAGGFIRCCVSDPASLYSCQINDPAKLFLPNKTYMITCTAEKVAGTWQVRLYHEGILSTGATAWAATGDIQNSVDKVNIGRTGQNNSFIGTIHEVAFRNGTADDAATILARYKRTIQTGLYWDDTSTAHYKMNEATLTNGVGLRDHSGNGNHLTTVSAAAPTPQYADMPWPAGSGTYKPAVTTSATGYFLGSSASALPDNQQPYSAIFWLRVPTNPTNLIYPFYVGGGAGFRTYVNNPGSGRLVIRLVVSDGTADMVPVATDLRDNVWHLIAAKITWNGAQWVGHVSIDGAAFSSALSGKSGDFSAGGSSIYLNWNIAAPLTDQSSTMLIKNYAITDADVASYWKAATTPVTGLTYSRTNKVCLPADPSPIDGERVRCWSAGQVPFTYESTLGTSMGNERSQFMLPKNDAITNLALQSEDATTTWTNNNTSDAANSAVSPDGSTTADTVTATAGAGDLRQTFAAIAAVPSTYCQYLKRNGAADVPGFVRMVTNSTGVQIAQTAFTASTGWARWCVSGTPTLNDTRIETQITTNGTSVYWWGAQLAATTAWTGTYCPTAAASVTCNGSTQYIASASIPTWTRAQAQVSWLGYSRNAAGFGYDLYNASNAGRHYLLSQGTEGWIYDSIGAGALQNRYSLANSQVSIPTGVIQSWDSTGTFYTDQAGVAQTAYGRTMQSSFSGPWPTYTTRSNGWVPVAGTNLFLGADNAGASSINGGIVNMSIHSTR